MSILIQRYPFTDGFNSLSHLIFGIVSFKISLVIPLFLFYQFQNKQNLLVDLAEFGCGYFLMLLFSEN